MDSIRDLTTRINAFRDARDWKQFHNPKDMALSISIESAELLEQFQWKNAEECEAHLQENREAVADEMADVAIYLFELADLLQMDLGETKCFVSWTRTQPSTRLKKPAGVTSNTTGWIDEMA